jgi:hypothetical protein
MLCNIYTMNPFSGKRAPAWLQFNNFGLWKYILIILGCLLIVGYILLTYLPKPDEAVLSHYGLSLSGYYKLVSTFVVVIALITAVGLYGSVLVKTYANLIKSAPEGNAFRWIANGFILLSLSVPLGSVVGAIAGQLAKNHLNRQPTLTIINNYIALALAAIALLMIARGTDILYGLFRKNVKPLPQKVWVFVFIAGSSLYSYFITIEPVTTPLAKRAYFLPGWMLIASIAIPYLYVWYRGLSAAYNIFLYQKNTTGRLYKSSLKYLAAGIFMVIISSIATRVLITTSPNLSRLNITPILFIIYGLLIIDASGYVLLAMGD